MILFFHHRLSNKVKAMPVALFIIIVNVNLHLALVKNHGIKNNYRSSRKFCTGEFLRLQVPALQP